jgi:hypothetical protein
MDDEEDIDETKPIEWVDEGTFKYILNLRTLKREKDAILKKIDEET